jgi:hypothetical protein
MTPASTGRAGYSEFAVRLVLVAFLFLSAPWAGRGEDLLATALQANSDLFSQLSEAHWIAVSEAIPENSFASQNGVKEAISHFEFWVQGPCWRYDIFNVEDSHPSLFTSHAYDGKYDQFFSPKDRLLTIQKASASGSFAEYGNYLLEPYAFLLEEETSTSFMPRTPLFSQLASPATWKARLAKMRLLSSTDQDLVARLDAGINPATKENYQYEIRFDRTRNWMPLELLKTNSTSKVVLKVRVLKSKTLSLKNGKQAHFPEEVESIRFENNGEKIFSVKTKASTFSDKVGDEDVFYLDPSIAETIYDKDADTYIKIPK